MCVFRDDSKASIKSRETLYEKYQRTDSVRGATRTLATDPLRQLADTSTDLPVSCPVPHASSSGRPWGALGAARSWPVDQQANLKASYSGQGSSHQLLKVAAIDLAPLSVLHSRRDRFCLTFTTGKSVSKSPLNSHGCSGKANGKAQGCNGSYLK